MLATRDDRYIAILVWNCASGHEALSIELRVEGLPAGASIDVNIHGLNLEAQETESQNLETSSTGELLLSFDLPDNGLRLIEIKPS